jgi:hypothetical protein
MTATPWIVLALALAFTHGTALWVGRRFGWRSSADELRRLKWANEILSAQIDRREQQLAKRVEEECRRRPAYSVGGSAAVVCA